MKETNQSVSWREFSYEAFWAAQLALGPSEGAMEQRIAVIPVLPIQTAVQQAEQSFPSEELRAEGIEVEQLLTRRTVAEIEDFLEELGFERCVGLDEVERLIEQQTLGVIQFTPKHLPAFTLTLEEINGKLVDVSAFNTNDFAAQSAGPTPVEMRANSIRRRRRDLAILHAVIHDEAARQTIRQRLNALRPRWGLA